MSVRKTLNVGKKLVTSVLKNTLTKYELSNNDTNKKNTVLYNSYKEIIFYNR